MNRVLVDENLPATLLFPADTTVKHATDFGDRITDGQLWIEARHGDFVILTKDVDFFDRLALFGAQPKVVWFRTGNMRRRDFEAFFAASWKQIANELENADLIEVHRDRIETLTFKKG